MNFRRFGPLVKQVVCLKIIVLFVSLILGSISSLACNVEVLAAAIDLDNIHPLYPNEKSHSEILAMQFRLNEEFQHLGGVDVNHKETLARMARWVDWMLRSQSKLDSSEWLTDGLAKFGIVLKQENQEQRDLQMSLISELPLEVEVEWRTIREGNRYLFVNSGVGFRIVEFFLSKKRLFNAFARWGCYRLSIECPDPNKSSAKLKVDFVPALGTVLGEASPAERVLFISMADHDGFSIVPQELSAAFSEIEPYLIRLFEEKYIRATVEKVKQLGLGAVLSTYPFPHDDSVAALGMSVLRHYGFEIDPFGVEASFWTKRSSGKVDPVITPAVKALEVLQQRGMVLVPIGLIPVAEHRKVTQSIRAADLKNLSVRKGLWDEVLSFSGPMPTNKAEMLYPSIEAAKPFQKLRRLEAQGNFVGKITLTALSDLSVTERTVFEKWGDEDWESVDLLRAITYMKTLSLRWDTENLEWR